MDHLVSTLMVTSPGPKEGKSLVAANLAVAMAQSGKRVILVDADQAAGRALEARVSALVPTPKPTVTLLPTPTSCPEVTYACNCRQVCSGRDCSKECDQCTKEKCE